MAAHCFSLPRSGLSGAGKNSNREAERVRPLYEQGNGNSLITTTAENETAFVNGKHWHAAGKGTEYKDNGQQTVVGPGAYNRKFYGTVTMRNGLVAKVKEEKTMNLYFPDAWMEQAQRVFERALVYQHTGAGEPLTPGWCSYFWGLTGDLADEYHYIVGRSLVNAGFRQNVPAWVYTHTHNPYTERGGK